MRELALVIVRRLGYAVLGVPDISAELDYFQNIIGLSPIAHSSDRAVLATSQGVETIVLEKADRGDLLALGLETGSDDALDDAVAQLGRHDVSASVREGRTPGVEQLVRFTDPGGLEVDLFSRSAFADTRPSGRGVDPIKLGHVARFDPEPQKLQQFYRDVLGFRLSDWRDQRAFFLRCSPDHHTVNFFKADTATLGHIAFEVKDWADLARCSDFVTQRGYHLDWGPSRHHIGHNLACYHRDPANIRIELYAEMDQMKDEVLGYFEPRIWHEDRPQVPKNWGDTVGRNAWVSDI